MKNYIPGKKCFKGYKLNANENQFLISKNIFFLIKIISKFFNKLNLYPSSSNLYISKIISNYYNLNENNIFVSNGSDESLFFLFFLFKNFKLKIPIISYPFYNIYLNYYNIVKKKIKFKNILNYKNIIFPNPNSPSGEIIKNKKIINKILKKNFIIIDEAYSEFYNLGIKKKINESNNLIIVNTLSKAFSFAGIRIGFIYSNYFVIKKIKFIKQCFNSYNINTISNYLAIENIKNIFFLFYNIQKNNYLKLLFNFFFKKNNFLKGNFIFIKKNIDFYFFFKKKNFFFRLFKNNIRITIPIFYIFKKIIKNIIIWS